MTYQNATDVAKADFNDIGWQDAPTSEKVGDLPHGPVMGLLQDANKFGLDALVHIAQDVLKAKAEGKTIVNILDLEDGERQNNSAYKAVIYATDVPAEAFMAQVERVRVLAVLASRVATGRAASDDIGEDIDRITEAAKVELAKLCNLDAELWQAIKHHNKSHLSIAQAARTDIDGNRNNPAGARHEIGGSEWAKRNRPMHEAAVSDGFMSKRDRDECIMNIDY